MKLRSLTLDNFRQFYGKQTLVFSTDEERNVTIVYGANGAGKSTLLAALTWGLYRTLPDAFEQHDRLVNDRAWSDAAEGDDVTARVIIEFDHDGEDYKVERKAVDRKLPNGARQRVISGDPHVEIRDRDGETRPIGNPNESMRRVLPEQLHRFFFFDGERIEHLTKDDSRDQIALATKNLLGLDFIEQAQVHLALAIKKLENDRRKSGSPGLQQIKDDLDEARGQLDEVTANCKMLEANRNALKQELSDIESRQAAIRDTREAQSRREVYRRQYDMANDDLNSQQQRQSREISNLGFLAFTGPLVARTRSIIDESRAKRALPAPYQRQFIEDLLHERECICGQPLIEGSVAYGRVQNVLSDGGDSDAETAAQRLDAHVSGWPSQRASLYVALHSIAEERSVQLRRRREAEEGLREVSALLMDQDSEEVQGLEQRHRDVEIGIESTSEAIFRARSEIDRLKKLADGLEKAFYAAEESNREAELAGRQIRAASAAKELFSQIFELRRREVHRSLDESIKRTYREISYKDHVPELSESFNLRLTSTTGPLDETIAKSTGENQILSLAFVGAVASLARDRYAEHQRDQRVGNATFSFQGGIYPVVMDSPFGSLDTEYRREIAAAIPKLAPQVVVFVSKSQGEGAVHDQLLARIGEQTVINFRTSKSDAREETIGLAGQQVPYVTRSGDGTAWATLERVQ